MSIDPAHRRAFLHPSSACWPENQLNVDGIVRASSWRLCRPPPNSFGRVGCSRSGCPPVHALRSVLLAGTASFALLTGSAHADDFSWTGNAETDDDWFAPGNWNYSPGTLNPLPGITDVVYIDMLSFAGSDTFTIAGVPIAEDAAVIEAGLGLEFAPNATLGLAYQGQIAEDSAQHGVKGDLTIRF